MRYGLSIFLLAGLIGCIGCGGPKGLSGLVKVTGAVTLKGSAVEGATVTFSPEAPGGRAAIGRTDANGRFELTTLNAKDGAMPGMYKVAVSKIVDMDADSRMTAEDMAKMVSGGKAAPMGPTPKGGSGKKAAGGIQHLIPEKYEDTQKSGLKADVTTSGPNDFTFKLD